MTAIAITDGMSAFIIIAILVALLLFANFKINKDKDHIAIRIRKDGKHSYHRVPANEATPFPNWLKILIFLIVASILFMPLDFLLNRS
ncbi:hypothetical protein [Nonlabens ponticola]|uniref:Uncharacterized protein n=1 Tax=Nonlabens ponticola TaxID=2496866 RepID=A0A3S9MYQ5_9FLAO|nr:hypothetical protein [Nonlabens ponticola]AZQ44232.1 hypothetical protein EJ995_08280 [Nonlabens ponticola]